MKHQHDVTVVEGPMPAEYWTCLRCERMGNKKFGGKCAGPKEKNS